MNATKLLFLFVFCVNIIYVSTYVDVCMRCDIVRQLFIFTKRILTRYVDPKYHNFGCLSYIFYGDKRDCNVSTLFNPVTVKPCRDVRNGLMPYDKKITGPHGVTPTEDDIKKGLKYTNNQIRKACRDMYKFNEPSWSPPTHYDFADIFKKIILKWVGAYRERRIMDRPRRVNVGYDYFGDCVQYIAAEAQRIYFSNVTLADG